ncbi:MAG: arginine--tRNA ligase [Candidatus Levybacteria bacterium]|nr:arginine--tRNA ligase [Candidatus Levybacteria bacterium]
MDAKKQIIESLVKAVGELVPDEQIDVELQEPKDESHGDYSSNVALVLGKKFHQNPQELAKKILDIGNWKFLDKVEAVAPGFINFYLSYDYLIDQLQEVSMQGQALRGKKIMVEFTDPNPFKEFHIGHLYSNAVGEALCRLLESQGATVKRVNYQGDVGLHIAKSLYAILQISNLEKKNPKERAKFLGKAYARGAKAYEEDEAAKKEINILNKKIYENDASIRELYQKGREWSLEHFETIYKRLGTKFEGYYFESVVGKIGLEYVRKHMDIFQESQGAVIFPGEKYGLHNRVFINSLGLPTYEAKELGLAPTKYKDFPYDLSIIVTGNEINAYFSVLLKALSLINPDLAAKTKHIGHGMVRLPTGKMSSRTGVVLTGEWLLDEAKERIQRAYKQMDETTAEKVAVGAVKYALLKSGIGRDISFSFEESISLEGNSGPYLQYTYARTQSVLAKVSSIKYQVLSIKLEPEELAILRAVHKFPEISQEAAEKFAPNLLCTYLFDLAQKFNLFYQKHKILESEEKEFRLALTASVGQVLKTGLYLLGIIAPERM